ncbi:M15 family metallopeptidase [Desulfopila aestuarii]|uniref:D-alanyl-D-alanine dipeptidase n=1 Tax=Desulfopila aestuarii DSM 18488 TaxID=1121416 RepID=A0A1M7YLX7_9BACT|nr:M15 family metallopeptidase [Desulfopila aestuarii]SHO53556.1 D-alanyl-D-alanine dipeptidase [Desulfopila aestuarii DSM 18488]
MQENMESKPIPSKREATWERVHSIPIIDCGEIITPLSLVPEHILVRSYYFELGIVGSLPECHARKSVLDKLLQASLLLPNHLRFVVLDAWRSQQLQKVLFKQCKSALANIYSDASEEEILAKTQQYVAIPSQDALAPSPHSTGGAIDLTIATRDGVPLFFGSPFDDPSEISNTNYFEDKLEKGELLSEREEIALKNRRILYNTMKQLGFVNYSCEWWHFEYGTQRWAIETGKEFAIYGPTAVSLNPFHDIENH